MEHKELVYKIIGSAMTVHNELGWGLLEKVYQEALSWELEEQGIKNRQEQEVGIYYKKHLLNKKYRMDIVVDDVIVELKSSSRICSAHRAQLCNYLRLTKQPVGLILNFGTPSLQGERWVYDSNTNECYLVDRNMEPLHYDDSLFNDGTVFIDTPDV